MNLDETVPGPQAARRKPEAAPPVVPVPFVPEKAAAARRSDRASGHSALRKGLEAVLRTLAAAAVSAALAAGVWQGWKWATRSKAFALGAVEIRGLVHAREEDLLRRSGLVRGGNLFHQDLGAAARAIEAHPWIKSARLQRVPPSRIVIEVQEHVAVAQVQLGSLYLLDADGALFKRAAPGDGIDLPLVTGLPRDEFLARRPEAQLRFFTALQLLDAWRDEGLPPVQLSEVRVDDDSGVTVFARDEQGGPGKVQEIRVGTRAFAQRLRRLAQVRAALARRGERAARIDLDNEARPEWVAAQLDKESAVHRRP
jgi:cell division protein FtsQ